MLIVYKIFKSCSSIEDLKKLDTIAYIPELDIYISKLLLDIDEVHILSCHPLKDILCWSPIIESTHKTITNLVTIDVEEVLQKFRVRIANLVLEDVNTLEKLQKVVNTFILEELQREEWELSKAIKKFAKDNGLSERLSAEVPK